MSAAANSALATLADVRLELTVGANDTSDDAWLTKAIAQVSAAVSRHCKRVFAPEQVQDVFDVEQDPYPYQTPGGFPQLALSRWPVLSVQSVVQTLSGGATPTTQALVQGTDFRVDAATGRLLRINAFTGVATVWEALPVTVIYAAGYGAAVVETEMVPGSPYQVTVQQAATYSCDIGVAYVSNGAALARVSANPAAGQYAVNTATGVYTFAAADAGAALALSYATVAIPADLTEVALRLVTARFRSKDRDPTLIMQDTPNVGTQRYWFGGAPGQRGAFPPDIEAALDDYRVPTVA